MLGLLLNKWVWIALVIGGLMTTIWIQGIRVKSAKAEVAKLSVAVEALQNANESNMTTIGELKNESEKLMKSYESRLKQKDKSIQDAIRICNLSPVGLGKGGTNASPTDDPVLLELNQLFPGN